MLSGEAVTGFLSFFPPMVTWCLVQVAIFTSTFEGGLAAHPEIPSVAANSVVNLATNCALRYMDTMKL